MFALAMGAGLVAQPMLSEPVAADAGVPPAPRVSATVPPAALPSALPTPAVQPTANSSPFPRPSGAAPGVFLPFPLSSGAPLQNYPLFMRNAKVQHGVIDLVRKDDELFLDLRPENFNKPYIILPSIARASAATRSPDGSTTRWS